MDIAIKNFTDLVDFMDKIQRYPNIGWIYRGQSSLSYPLLPKAGRDDYFDPTWGQNEKEGFPPKDLGRFNSWRSQAVAYSQTLPQHDLECLAFAQHYGLATRLLDWSTNPLVALYFAYEKHQDVEGAVFCYLPWVCIANGEMKLNTIDKVAMYSPRPFDRRILAQSGCFTYHPKPEVPIEGSKPHPEVARIAPDGDLVKFIVSKDLKPMIQRQLSEIGISRKSLFSDLDGLSDYINWGTSMDVKGKKKRKRTMT